jgi:hypothetical protein
MLPRQHRVPAVTAYLHARLTARLARAAWRAPGAQGQLQAWLYPAERVEPAEREPFGHPRAGAVVDAPDATNEINFQIGRRHALCSLCAWPAPEATLAKRRRCAASPRSHNTHARNGPFRNAVAVAAPTRRSAARTDCQDPPETWRDRGNCKGERARREVDSGAEQNKQFERGQKCMLRERSGGSAGRASGPLHRSSSQNSMSMDAGDAAMCDCDVCL